MNPKVSIILPCYKMEAYLRRCIDSIIAESYSNKEVILVDDGSPDTTPELIDRICEEFDCCVAIHKENGGVSSARNAGLAIATGKYVMFIDPDDYIKEGFITHSVQKAESTGADMVLMGYTSSWFRPLSEMLDYPPLEDYSMKSNAEVIQYLFPRFFGREVGQFVDWAKGVNDWDKNKELPAIWRFLYKRSLITDNCVCFQPLKQGEDATFVWDCLSVANKVSTISECPYVYIPRQEGALATTTRPESILETKLLILEQRDRIALNLYNRTNMDITSQYAGSNLFSCLQLGYELSKSGSVSQWRKYYKQKSVRSAISCMPVVYRGGLKRVVPLLLLKMRAFVLLFMLFKVSHKLNIASNIY